MQYDLETTDTSLDLFGSAKSKLIDDKITKKKEKPFLLMLRASTSAKNFLISKNARAITMQIKSECDECLTTVIGSYKPRKIIFLHSFDTRNFKKSSKRYSVFAYY